MEMVKIHIADKEASGRAFAALVRRGRGDCYRDQVYVVPAPALTVLADMGIAFAELGGEKLDLTDKSN